jgi:hypothetical protein
MRVRVRERGNVQVAKALILSMKAEGVITS